MWLIGVASKKVQPEYFKLVLMTSSQLDALKTLENAVQCSMKLYLFVIVYISMCVPVLNDFKAHFMR